MGQICTVCAHPEKMRIDGLIVEGVALRDIARQTGLNRMALQRHAKSHLPATMVRAAAAAEVAHADGLLDRLRRLESRAEALGLKAEKVDDFRASLNAVREIRGCLELYAKLSGELDERAIVNVVLSPEWVRVRSVLITALADHPAARIAVAAALAEIEGVSGHVGP